MTDDDASGAPSLRLKLAVYAAGMFGFTQSHVVTVAVPLWALTLDPSPSLLGFIIGSRHIPALIFGIHAGILMDRLGARRVLLVCAFTSMFTALAYPLLPWIPALIFLQMLSGLAQNTAWNGAQTLIGQALGSDTTHAGRMSFANRVGMLSGPPLVGVMWDMFGGWGAFSILFLWAIGVLVATLSIPAAATAPPNVQTFRARDLLPRLSDYGGAFRLLKIRPLAFVILVATLIILGEGVQHSFYIVYCQAIGLPGTSIGILVAAPAVLGGVGALTSGWLSKIFDPNRLLLTSAIGTAVLMGIVPLLGAFLPLLISNSLRGGLLGINQPILISGTVGSVARAQQGQAVGLRSTINRFGHVGMPIVMGVTVELVGLENSFFLMGTIVVALMLAASLLLRKMPDGGGAR